MNRRENNCRACQEELAYARGRHGLPASLVIHLGQCPVCQSFGVSVNQLAHLAQAGQNEPSPDLVARTMDRLSPELAARTREGTWLRVRLAFAGFISLPVILGLNGLLIWLVYTTLATWWSESVAVGAASMVAASTLLGLSLAYGSLPLMADWGLELRHRYPNLAWRPQ